MKWGSEQGISLVELMVSLLLSGLIMSLLIQQYLTIKRQYLYAGQELEKSAELMLVSELLRDSTRRAGFTPCANISHLISLDRQTGKSRLSGIITGVQSVEFLRMSESFSPVSGYHTNPLQVAAASGFQAGEEVLIADCFHAEVGRIKRVRKMQQQLLITLEQPLYFEYSQPVYLGAWLRERFFIRNKALFYKSDHAEELTPFVNQMTATLRGERLSISLGFGRGESLVLETRGRQP